MTRHPVENGINTLSELTKKGIELTNNIKGKIIPAQSKSHLDIRENVNAPTPVALVNATSATHQNSINFRDKTKEKFPKDQK